MPRIHPSCSATSCCRGRYTSQCYSEVEVRLVRETVPSKTDMSGAKDYVREQGDDEMGGGPVKVNAELRLSPDGRKLVRGRLQIRLEEDKQDHSAFVYTRDFEVFDLVQGFKGQPNPLEECRVPPARWTRLQPVSGTTNVYGSLSHRTLKDQRWVNMNSNNNGLISNLTCMVDGVGRDDKVRCDPPRLNAIYVSLVNVLDEEAEQWASDRPPRVGPRLQPGRGVPR